MTLWDCWIPISIILEPKKQQQMTNKNSFLNQCKENLIDRSARNNLVSFNFSSSTCLDLEKYSKVKKEGKKQELLFEIQSIDKFKNDENLSEKEKLQKRSFVKRWIFYKLRNSNNWK